MKHSGHLFRRHLRSLLLFALPLLATGCPEDSDDDGGVDETGGPPPPQCPECNDCNAQNDEKLYVCICDPIVGDEFVPTLGCWLACSSNPSSLATDCGFACQQLIDPNFENAYIQEVPCQFAVGSESCVSWDPANGVTRTGSIHHIDESFVADLVADPDPLWICDDAYFAAQSGGGFTLVDANSGELLYELGLRNDDVPLTLNGFPLDNYHDVASVFVEEYRTNGETEYTLTVQRGANNVNLFYELDP
jgi:hypothetical protein